MEIKLQNETPGGLTSQVRNTIIFGFITTFAVAFAFGFYVASAMAAHLVLEAAK